MSKPGFSHLLVLAATGLAGWVALASLTLRPVEFLRPVQLSWDFVAIVVLAALSRLSAVRVFRRVRVALDSAFYVSAAFIFGLIPAAWMVLFVLTGDALVRLRTGTGVVLPGERPRRHIVAQILHYGGMPAAVLLGVGAALRIDRGQPFSDGQLAWLEPAFALGFLVVYYSIAGSTQWLSGERTSSVMREFLGKVLGAEITMVPLALAMVLGHVHQGPALYLLLGCSCLVFNYVFRRASVASENLQQRVEELSTLNTVGRMISGNLERRALLSNMARETLRLVRHQSRFMIGLIDRKSDLIRHELFDGSGNGYRAIIAPRGEGLSGWVMDRKEPLLLRDVQRDYSLYSKSTRYNDSSFHSWLGVPLIIYDEVVGVMSVQSEQPKAYTSDHLRVLTTIADQAAVALENSRLFELATVDGLTGLLVRRHFDQRLDEEWHRASRYGTEFSVGMMDLDGFKILNDRFGHQAGDQVLRTAAAVLRRNMRTADLAGRYGGEEFAFLLPRTRLSEAMTVAERIRSDVERATVNFGGETLRVSACLGVAAFPESGARHIAELVALADEAMYHAKRLGKNRVCASPGAAARLAIPATCSESEERGVV